MQRCRDAEIQRGKQDNLCSSMFICGKNHYPNIISDLTEIVSSSDGDLKIYQETPHGPRRVFSCKIRLLKNGFLIFMHG
jgi:hypothetical protein